MSPGWSIARRLFLAHAIFIVVLAAFVGTASFVDARDRGYTETADRMLAVATAIADNPLVLEASHAANPSDALQPYALDVAADADLDFITIMHPDRTRWTHPTASEIGQDYIGSIGPALSGEPFTEVSTGTLGPSVRAVVPVVDEQGTVRALVAVGVTTSNLSIALAARLPAVLGLAMGLLAAGSVATWLLGRYLRRVTLGWGPEQLAQMFVYLDSVLHSVREGLVLVDHRGELVLYNDQAARLLGIPPRSPDPAAAPVLPDLDLPASLAELLRSGRVARDEIHPTGSRVLVVSQQPALASAAGRGKPAAMGSVATIRDHTDLQALGSELQSMRTLSDALRAQTHEHSNRLHVLVSLMELGRISEAVEFATGDLELSRQLTDEMINAVDEPVIGALLMGKTAQAHELGISLTVAASGSLSESGLSVQDLVTVLGNLVDNALDAAASGEAPRSVDLVVRAMPDSVVIEVSDSGAGVPAEAESAVLRPGFSTKDPGSYGRGLGLALVRQTVARLGGILVIGRRDGAVFAVTLPARPHPPASPAANLTGAPHA
ncbi:sensor histidine kinase [Cryobacterium tagatosivorans]|uniref:histidine kinase n=1 Tax=Cryobacterium tagatosivorans TaxID=1259199 RepID=A0A4R8UD83_9MICO|nr:sensor histidine kinase [Cryobacterium tagatosivorans]TFB48966.1 sensor histidine kinase [Cryobacterium tagatosivorans]